MLESFASATLAVSLLLVSQSTASAREWDSDYGRARAHAQSIHKPLLVILDKPGDARHRIEPVRLVKEQPTSESADLLDAYELCHVDISTEYGQKVAQAFKAEEMPYMAILDKTGRKIVYQHAGPLTGAEWQTALAAHQRGELPQASPAAHVVPTNHSYLQQPIGLYAPSGCTSCQRGW